MRPFDCKIWWKQQRVLISYLFYAALSNDKKYLGSISHDKMLKVAMLSLSLLVCPYVGLTWPFFPPLYAALGLGRTLEWPTGSQW